MSDSQERQKYDGNDGEHQAEAIEIKIDRTTFKVKQKIMTGAELRKLPVPEIGLDRDLFEVVPGGSDLKIEAQQPVTLRNGMRFFTAPALINPGMV